MSKIIFALLYGRVSNDPVPLALLVTLAMQPSEMFYRALVPFSYPVIRIIPFIICLFIQQNAAPFVRVKDEEHPKKLTSQMTSLPFLFLPKTLSCRRF